MTGNNFLGSSKVSANQKITIIKKANRILQVEEGDIVTFYDDGLGNVTLKKVKIV